MSWSRIIVGLSMALEVAVAGSLLPEPAMAAINFGCASMIHVRPGATAAEIGATAAQAMPEASPSEVTTFVDTVASRMKAVGDHPAKYTIRVIGTSIPDACAFAGGYIFVTLGLLQIGLSDAELAFVIGHEIAHIDHNHTDMPSSDPQAATLLQNVGALGGGFKAEVDANICSTASRDATSNLAVKRRRLQEIEADRQAIWSLSAAGYDVSAAVSVLLKIASASGDACHPSAAERERNARQWIQEAIDHLQLFDVATRFLLVGQYQNAIDGFNAFRDYYSGPEPSYNLALAMHRAAQALMPYESRSKGRCSLAIRSETLVHRWRERFPITRNDGSGFTQAAVRALLADAELKYNESLSHGGAAEGAVPALLGRGCLYLDLSNLGLGKIRYAEADIEEAIERQPTNPLVRNDLGVLRLHQGRLQDALRDFRASLELAPDNQIMASNLVQAQMMAGDQGLPRQSRPEERELSRSIAGSPISHDAPGTSCGGTAAARRELAYLSDSLGTPERQSHLFNLSVSGRKELEPQVVAGEFRRAGSLIILKKALLQGRPVELIEQIVASAGSHLKTASGLGIGDSESDLRKAYGEPDQTDLQTDRRVLIFCERGLAFGLREGVVVDWFAFQ